MTLYNGFISFDTADHIVGLHGQNLLQGVRRAISLQRPHFHFTETLAAELCFTAERLLRDQRVRTGGTGVDLIIYQVVQFQIIHVAHRDQIIKRFAGAAVIQLGLRVLCQRNAGEIQLCGIAVAVIFFLSGVFRHNKAGANVFLTRAVKHRGADVPTKCPGGIAQVHLQHLPDIHTGRNAERIQHDIKRCAVRQEGHVFTGKNAGYNALVTVAAGHFIAHRNLTFLGDVATHHHIHTGA